MRFVVAKKARENNRRRKVDFSNGWHATSFQGQKLPVQQTPKNKKRVVVHCVRMPSRGRTTPLVDAVGHPESGSGEGTKHLNTERVKSTTTHDEVGTRHRRSLSRKVGHARGLLDSSNRCVRSLGQYHAAEVMWIGAHVTLNLISVLPLRAARRSPLLRGTQRFASLNAPPQVGLGRLRKNIFDAERDRARRRRGSPAASFAEGGEGHPARYKGLGAR